MLNFNDVMTTNASSAVNNMNSPYSRSVSSLELLLHNDKISNIAKKSTDEPIGSETQEYVLAINEAITT
jgi:hypothetical protein